MNPWEMNPYAGQMQADQSAIGAATTSAQNRVTSLGNQMGNYNQESTYPAYPNQYGLGAPINPPKAEPIPNQANPNALQGANPWSLIGESNARGE